MLEENATLYDIYLQAFGKVRSGTLITDKDYSFPNVPDGRIPFDTRQRAAVTVAVSDQKAGREMRTKQELETEINRLVSGQ